MNRIFPTIPFAASVPNLSAPARAVLDSTFPLHNGAPSTPLARRVVAAAADWAAPDSDPAFLRPFATYESATRFALAAQFVALRYIFDAAAPYAHDGTAAGAIRTCVRYGLLAGVSEAEFLNRAITYACRWQGLTLGTDEAVAEAATLRQIAASRSAALMALADSSAYTESEAEPMGEGMDADDASQDGA
jgi:hypothetical protein